MPPKEKTCSLYLVARYAGTVFQVALYIGRENKKKTENTCSGMKPEMQWVSVNSSEIALLYSCTVMLLT